MHNVLWVRVAIPTQHSKSDGCKQGGTLTADLPLPRPTSPPHPLHHCALHPRPPPTLHPLSLLPSSSQRPRNRSHLGESPIEAVLRYEHRALLAQPLHDAVAHSGLAGRRAARHADEERLPAGVEIQCATALRTRRWVREVSGGAGERRAGRKEALRLWHALLEQVTVDVSIAATR